MSYLDSGFDNNLIRDDYPDTENVEDSPIIGEIMTADALPPSDITDSLVIAGVLDSDSNLIVDIINENLDSQAKQILGEFTFGTSGAIAISTDDDNGLWLSPTGILAKKSGTNTFTIEADGDATFGGSLVAASGTLGSLLIADGGSIRFGKTSFTDDVNAGFWLGDAAGVAKFNIGSSATKYFQYDGSNLVIAGGAISGGTIIGTTFKANNGSGLDVWIESDGKVSFRYNNSTKAYLVAESSGSFILNSDGTFHIQGQEYVQVNYNYGGGTGEFLIYNDDTLVFKLNDAKDAWFKQDVSADSFTDRTPHFSGNALEEIRKIKGKNGNIDHDTLPAFIKNTYENEKKELIVGRNLSNTVSMLLKSVIELEDRIKVLESKAK